jgi:hypothetical protein
MKIHGARNINDLNRARFGGLSLRLFAALLTLSLPLLLGPIPARADHDSHHKSHHDSNHDSDHDSDHHSHGQFNRNGDILIADQFNNRVIEATPEGEIVWSFGLGPNDFSPNSIIGCNDAQRVGDFTLMAGTGTPAGVIPQSPGGAADNRVILVDKHGRIKWQYGQFGQTGDGPNLLSTPVQSTWLPSTDVLITDQGNNRIIEVNLHKQIVW